LRVGGIKRSKYEAAEPPNAAKDASMQADSGAAAEIDEGPTASAAAAASTATDAAAGAHSSDLSSPLFSSAPPKPTKGEQKLAREAETATNAQKLWDIVRSQNLPNTVSPAELRELMGVSATTWRGKHLCPPQSSASVLDLLLTCWSGRGCSARSFCMWQWSPQKVASGIKDILSHWATDGRGPPTPEVSPCFAQRRAFWDLHPQARAVPFRSRARVSSSHCALSLSVAVENLQSTEKRSEPQQGDDAKDQERRCAISSGNKRAREFRRQYRKKQVRGDVRRAG